jgi:tartrate dehydrogenase/decarboxylase/D-malate dehydrogenase
MMLDHLGHSEGARAITTAIETVLADGTVLTRDLGGKASTAEMADAIAALIG